MANDWILVAAEIIVNWTEPCGLEIGRARHIDVG